MKRTITFAIAAAAATFAVASPAQAALTKTNDCKLTDVSPNATACRGWFSGNLLAEGGGKKNEAMKTDIAAELLALGFVWDKVTIIQKIDGGGGSNIIDFAGLLSGKTIIGVHRGGFAGGGETAFFAWNNLDKQDKITLNLSGLSGHTLYVMGVVPEPSTWLLMIAGVGLVGWQLRRRRQTVKVSYA